MIDTWHVLQHSMSKVFKIGPFRSRPVLMQSLISVWSWSWLSWFQVLCWHQTDHLSQWPGDELCSGWTVQGECRHRSELTVQTHRGHWRWGSLIWCFVFQNYSGELNYLVALHELYKYINKYYDQVSTDRTVRCAVVQLISTTCKSSSFCRISNRYPQNTFHFYLEPC